MWRRRISTSSTHPRASPLRAVSRLRAPGSCFLGNATVRGRAWYKLVDAPVISLDLTVSGDLSKVVACGQSCWRAPKVMNALEGDLPAQLPDYEPPSAEICPLLLKIREVPLLLRSVSLSTFISVGSALGCLRNEPKGLRWGIAFGQSCYRAPKVMFALEGVLPTQPTSCEPPDTESRRVHPKLLRAQNVVVCSESCPIRAAFRLWATGRPEVVL